jgi:UDP-N-acetylmuramate--alanine ligase
MDGAGSGSGRRDAAAAGATVVETNARRPHRESAVNPAAGSGRLGAGEARVRTVHVVGIGGAGMSAIATVLHAMGHTVTGSDLKASAVTERLTGGRHPRGHRPSGRQPRRRRLVTVSSAMAEDNPEIVEARRRGIPVLTRPKSLAAIASLKRCIAVAGTHGKTTTASMLALELVEAGWHLVPHRRRGQRDRHQRGVGRRCWLVVEADESDGTFLALAPDIAVVTNVEADHLDHYGSFAALRSAFESSWPAPATTGWWAGMTRWPPPSGGPQDADVVGTGPQCTYRIVDLTLARSSVSFALVGPDG